MHLRNHIAVVVIAQRSRQFLIVHRRLVLAFAPQLRHTLRIGQLELAGTTDPRNNVPVLPFGQHLQQKLPQLNLAIVSGSVALVRRLDTEIRNKSHRFHGRLLHEHWSTAAADDGALRLHRLHVLVVAVVVADVTGNGGHLETTQQFDVREEHIVRINGDLLVKF